MTAVSILALVAIAGPAAAQSVWVGGSDGIQEIDAIGSRTVLDRSGRPAGIVDLAVDACGAYFAVETTGTGTDTQFLVAGSIQAVTGCTMPTGVGVAPLGGQGVVACEMPATLLNFNPVTAQTTTRILPAGTIVGSPAIDDANRAFLLIEDAGGMRSLMQDTNPVMLPLGFVPGTVAIGVDGSVLVGGSNAGAAEVVILDPVTLAPTVVPQPGITVLDVGRAGAGTLYTIVDDGYGTTSVLEDGIAWAPAAGVTAPLALVVTPAREVVQLDAIVRSVDAVGVPGKIKSGKRASIGYTTLAANKCAGGPLECRRICALSAEFPAVGAKTLSGQLGAESFSTVDDTTHPRGFWSSLSGKPRWTQTVSSGNSHLEGTLGGDDASIDTSLEIDEVGLVLETRILAANSRVGVTLTSIDIPGLESVSVRLQPTRSRKNVTARSGTRRLPAGTTVADLAGKMIRLDATVVGSVSASSSSTVEIVRAAVEVKTRVPGQKLVFAFDGDGMTDMFVVEDLDPSVPGFDDFFGGSGAPRPGNTTLGGRPVLGALLGGRLQALGLRLIFLGASVEITMDALGASNEQQRCVKAVPKSAGELVAKAQTQESERCLQALSSQNMVGGFEACVSGDLAGRVQKRIDAASQVEAKRCVAPLPSWAYAGAAVTSQAAKEAGQKLARDLFGDPLVDVTVVPKTADPGAAACQKESLRRTNRLAGRILREVLRSATRAMKPGRSGAMVGNAAELETHVAQEFAAGSGILKEQSRVQPKIDKRCAGVAALPALFPGSNPTDTADLAQSAIRDARCRACQVLNATYAIAVDCDLADNQSADASCSP